MAKIKIAQIALDKVLYHFDKAYDYCIPEALLESTKVGSRVLVSFGSAGKMRQGIVLDISEKPKTDNMKSIFAVLDKAPLLNNEMISLVFWMKRRYYCTFFDAVNVLLPAGIHMKVTVLYRLADNLDANFLESVCEQEREILELFGGANLGLSKEKLEELLPGPLDAALLESLVERKILAKEEFASRKTSDAYVKMVKLCETENEEMPKLGPKQKYVYDTLCELGSVSLKELREITGVTVSVVNALVKKGVAQYFLESAYRNPYANARSSETREEIILTKAQQEAYASLCALYHEDSAAVSLLYGVTGSGKTSVFMKLIDEVHASGRGVIVMVPEISLTVQLISLFHSRYGENVAIFHSALSSGERLDEWKRVKEGKATIVVGTRSAVFAPLENLGLIVIDEEQEHTYKSEASPRFHARDVAKFRCNHHMALLVLSSATPSIESYYLAKTGRYHLAHLSARYGKCNLPEVSIADMNEELERGNAGLFSAELVENLKRTLQEEKQAIILMNRRGYNTFAMCRSCGAVLFCPHCSISLTYHRANGRLLCHYCGYGRDLVDKCPACGDRNIQYRGAGTQKVEQELENLFPQARVLRMDADSTREKFSYEKKLGQFARGEFDIMIGTQMVAKGLNFPNVTFVGVLCVDSSLYSEDFRSYERTFSLLTQVVGRSGRGDCKGRAIIQTFTPENPVITLAARQDYDAFFAAEINIRKRMLYPPFADICVVGFVGSDEKSTSHAASEFLRKLKDLAQNNYPDLPLRALGSSAASVVKVNNKYRYRLILKCRNSKNFREMMSSLLVWFGASRLARTVTAFVDMNPDTIL